MRTDVKLGIGLSMVVVLVAGGYFLFRGKGEAPVPVGQKTAAVDPAASKGTPAKPGVQPAKSRQTLTNKDPGAGKTVPAGPASADGRPANKIAGRPAVGQPAGGLREQPSPTAGSNMPVASAPVPSASKPSPDPVRLDAPPNVNPSPTSPDPSSDVGRGVAANPPPSNSTSPPQSASLTSTEPVALNPAVVPSTGADLPAPLPLNTGSPSVSLPALSSRPEPRPAATDSHKVQPGDSLASLSQTYYGNKKYSKFLADSNPQITDANHLALGAMVKIPSLPADIDAKPPASTSPTVAKSGAATTTVSGKRSYKVQPGDSFYRIAREQLGSPSRWKELFALNKSAVHGDPTSLRVGQTLVLPES